ncbi:cytidine deaminase [Robertkochia solimangrovi]|uniref:cytidine deaminase n=1 Tax=Robertkochia solimangrovi TaxID=2213046 RepID=UPI00117DABE7|nr:cytidine deaminase [Robertkochia solimangrovi]TRZ44276.1 cytidine deaminase [Robertkochia solimangrovi]
MRKFKISSEFTVYDGLKELPEEVRYVMLKAVQARSNAYAPYSKFRVGAALLMDNGDVVVGNNQENAAYPNGLCAERVAIYHAGAVYPGMPVRFLCVTAASELRKVTEAIPPCGSCRQTIAEYEENQNSPIPIYFMGDSGEIIMASSLSDLLPLIFSKDSLNNI